MTAQILSSELSTLIQDSKRKNHDIRTAAEKSLGDLKALPNTSESQLAADLRKRPLFVHPFILSCSSKNPKLAGTSLACIQRLVVSNSLAHETLKDVLGGLRDCTGLAQDIQLKILQILPSLLQNYASLIADELLATALHTCFLLLASKTGVISRTAAATLQQIVVSVFDRVVQEDDLHTDHYIIDVPIENGEISVQKSALDAYKLLNDLCVLAEGRTPDYLQAVQASPNFCLELIEAILSNHAGVISTHPEQVHILRLKIMPFMIRTLSDRLPFTTTVRSMRLLPMILGSMLNVLSAECEMVLGLINHMLEPDAGLSWKRVLCMEVLRSIHLEPTLVRSIYSNFDAQEGKRNIIQEQMSLMVHLASEKPTIIGLGQQSTVPATDQGEEPMDEMAALQVEGISGTIGVAVTLKSSTAPGISARLSSMRVSCLEQLDKNEPPSIPPAYIYSLVLICLNQFSEGIAKFLLPFTVPNEKVRRKTRVKDDNTSTKERDNDFQDTNIQAPTQLQSFSAKTPVNPLVLRNNVLYDQIKACSQMVETCWPALLAAYSTFFYATLDNEYYRDLVRSFQKFTQISGLLHLWAPRDAFLTALGKNAVPAASSSLFGGGKDSDISQEDIQVSENQKTASESARTSVETTSASLNPRNLLCLRALLNLGIALGPVLGDAWKIVLGTLQQANIIINRILSMKQRGRPATSHSSDNDPGFLGDVGDQISAVEATSERLIESTRDLPTESYLEVLESLCSLFVNIEFEEAQPNILRKTSPVSGITSHKRGHSVSRHLVLYTIDSRMNLFVLDHLNKLVQHNSFRFLRSAIETSGWPLLSKALHQVTLARNLDSTIRVRAAKVLAGIISTTASPNVSHEHLEETRYQGLCTLNHLLTDLYSGLDTSSLSPKDCEAEIHCLLLGTLHTALEIYGESLIKGWPEIFSIINSIFENGHGPVGSTSLSWPRKPRVSGSKFVRTAFSPLQLVCSDFLRNVPEACFVVLLRTTSSFCMQKEEFNISLTSTTLFCNISDYIWDGETAVTFHSKALQHIESPSVDQNKQSKSETWSELLLALVESTTDERPEIRQGAVHSIFRIMDGCGDRMTPQSWIQCQLAVSLPCLINNQEKYMYSTEKTNTSGESEESLDWNETCTIILSHLPGVFSFVPGHILGLDDFKPFWEALLVQLDAILQRESLFVSSAVFSALSKISAELGDRGQVFQKYAVSLWSLWESRNPTRHKGLPRKVVDNQAALLAYTRCFVWLYPQAATNLDGEAIRLSLKQLRYCVEGSSLTSYSGDVDSLSPLQEQVIQCVKSIRIDDPYSIAQIGFALSDLAALAVERHISGIEAKGPTFVAISKVSMDLLTCLIEDHRNVKEIHQSGMVSKALELLARSIRQKYSWEYQGKDPQLWKRATQSTVDILRAAVPVWSSSSLSAESEISLWETTLSCCKQIISAPDEFASGTQQLHVGQDFDVESFSALIQLIVPIISLNMPDTTRLFRTLAKILLDHSFLHDPHPDDLPSLGEEIEQPLARIGSKHIGRTSYLKPSPRWKVGYKVTEKLFDLVTASDDDLPEPEIYARKRLATATGPFFTLRICLALKAYILDQPLRGRMPQPASQRKELLYLLRKLIDLKSDPAAFEHIFKGGDLNSEANSYRKHLFVVHPLVVRAMSVTKRDDELRKTLATILTTLSENMNELL